MADKSSRWTPEDDLPPDQRRPEPEYEDGMIYKGGKGKNGSIPRHIGGRRSLLTPEVLKRTVEYIRRGCTPAVAARAVGILPVTYYRWLERGRAETKGVYFDLVQAIELAEAELEAEIVRSWKNQTPADWRAAEKFLEKRFPERWKHAEKIEVTGKDGGAIQVETLKGKLLERLNNLSKDTKPRTEDEGT